MDTEVTQKMFKDLMGYNLSDFGPNSTSGNKGMCSQDDCPVETVTWFEVAASCISFIYH